MRSKPRSARKHRSPPPPKRRGPPKPRPQASATRDPAEEKRRIHAAVDGEMAAIAAGDRDAYLGMLTKDAVFMAPTLEAKTGGALHEFLDELLHTVSVKWLNYEHVETTIVGDLAFHVFTCRWQATPKAGGAPRVMRFKGLHVLCRRPDGSWRIRREIWNASPESRPPF